jgi:hypothetical protein
MIEKITPGIKTPNITAVNMNAGELTKLPRCCIKKSHTG